MYAVGMLSPATGDAGDSAATFSDGIALDPTLPTQAGKAVVTAASPTAAISAALTNTIVASFQGQSAGYDPDATTVGTSPAAQLPFVVTTTSTPGQYRLLLEDLANMPGLPPDWDYNDRSWTVTVTELTAITSSPSAPAEESADGSRPAVVTLTRSNTTPGSLDQPLYLPFTLSGTATPGVDFEMPSSLIAVFWPGETQTRIVLPIKPDAVPEGPEEVIVHFDPTDGISPFLPDTRIDIYDPVTLPPLPPEPPPPAVREVWVSGALDGEERPDGLRPVVFHLSRTPPTAQEAARPLTVYFSLGGTASTGTDYTTPSAYTATFAPGQNTLTLTLGVVHDELTEGVETVELTLIPERYSVRSSQRSGEADIFDYGQAPSPPQPVRGTASVSGTVWFDVIENHTQDLLTPNSDTPLADRRVNLLDSRGGVVMHTYTNSAGQYNFTRLPDGGYQIQVEGDILRPFVQKDVGSDQYDSDVGADGYSDPFTLDGTNNSANVSAGFKRLPVPSTITPGVQILRAGVGAPGVAKWEKAFVVDKNNPNKLALVPPDRNGDDFIDLDTDRFYVRVIDGTVPANQPVFVTIATTHPNPARAEYQDTPTRLTLLPVDGRPGEFISDSQILVSNEVDDKYERAAAANPNWTGGGQGKAGGIGEDDHDPHENATNSKKIDGKQYHFPVSDRTHIIALGGEVVLGYNNAPQPATYSVPVKKTVKVHVNVLNVPKTDANGQVIPNQFEPAVDNAVVEADIKKVREIYAQIGLDVQYSLMPIQVQPPPNQAWRLPPNGPEVVDAPAGSGLDTPNVNPSLKLRSLFSVQAAAKNTSI